MDKNKSYIFFNSLTKNIYYMIILLIGYNIILLSINLEKQPIELAVLKTIMIYTETVPIYYLILNSYYYLLLIKSKKVIATYENKKIIVLGNIIKYTLYTIGIIIIGILVMLSILALGTKFIFEGFYILIPLIALVIFFIPKWINDIKAIKTAKKILLKSSNIDNRYIFFKKLNLNQEDFKHSFTVLDHYSYILIAFKNICLRLEENTYYIDYKNKIFFLKTISEYQETHNIEFSEMNDEDFKIIEMMAI